jgi:crotonobetainyl-CoA:carnitine CoA-transferase CaiB-like acyl-CoA transferase
MSIASGILAAVIGKMTTGMGTRLDASLYSASVWYNSVSIVSAQERYGNQFPKSNLNPHNPFSGIFKGSDNEWIIITINQYNQTYNKLCSMLEMTDLIDNPLYSEVSKLKNDEAVMKAFMTRMFDAFETKTSKEWFRIFQKNDLPCEILVHHKDVSTDPQALENGYIRNVEFKNGEKIAMPTTPVQFSAYDTECYETYCKIGMNTKDFLLYLGYTEEQIEELVAKKVCIC